MNEVLAETRKANGNRNPNANGAKTEDHNVHSLLENDLGVPLPLHVSLSRPLILTTANKDQHLLRLKQAVVDSGVKAFKAILRDVIWHPNEISTRWFLVLRLQSSSTPELTKLLDLSNSIALEFGQPLLYSDDHRLAKASNEHFHISIAWSLQSPVSDTPKTTNSTEDNRSSHKFNIPDSALNSLASLSLTFSEVKVRIGQDVHPIPLKPRRQSSSIVK